MSTDRNGDSGQLAAVTGNATGAPAIAPAAVVIEAARHRDEDECGCERLDNGECGCLRDR